MAFFCLGTNAFSHCDEVPLLARSNDEFKEAESNACETVSCLFDSSVSAILTEINYIKSGFV